MNDRIVGCRRHIMHGRVVTCNYCGTSTCRLMVSTFLYIPLLADFVATIFPVLVKINSLQEQGGNNGVRSNFLECILTYIVGIDNAT